MRRRPASVTTVSGYPIGARSRDAMPSTVTISPTCSDVFDQPLRARLFGLPISITHRVAPAPCASATSRWKNAWGFLHSKRVTMPVSVTVREGSYEALNQWCA